MAVPTKTSRTYPIMSETDINNDLSPTPASSPTLSSSQNYHHEVPHVALASLSLSPFESVFTSYPPILESLIAHLPTLSLLNLYRTSHHLRKFLRAYPLAWSTLSFRLPQQAAITSVPGNETPELRERQSKAQAIDTLLVHVVAECGTRLRSLDLCNTAVSGIALMMGVCQPRRATLQHLSVRGCKNVSIKYHILPYLQYSSSTLGSYGGGKLALKSLYAYRCRHHRRRPYLPSSLVRRDSDSEPTHELIELCHKLGIWTDTAWCPTPGGRCYRRKDYHSGRVVLTPGPEEVWVPFDRLWRSGNRIGPGASYDMRSGSKGLLWEDMETGYDGEPLGTSTGPFWGEGKHVTAHLRKSHRIFVENITCHQCGESISERCEQCSVRMHCMGCRKTLCASCAFDRPLKDNDKRTRDYTNLALGYSNSIAGSLQGSHSSSMATGSSHAEHREAEKQYSSRFWWAPGASRSPNLMTETPTGNANQDGENTNNTAEAGENGSAVAPPKLKMHWCCLEPIFSGGGGIAFLGPNLGGEGAHKIRAAPLPEGRGYEDPDFLTLRRTVDRIDLFKSQNIFSQIFKDDADILPYLQQPSLELQATTCPRSLCNDCFSTFQWKLSCRGCRKPLCKEHDFRALKVRRCGFRDFSVERDYVQSYPSRVDAQIISKSKLMDLSQTNTEEEIESRPNGEISLGQLGSPVDRGRTIKSKPSLPSMLALLNFTPSNPGTFSPHAITPRTGRQRASSFSNVISSSSSSAASKHLHNLSQFRLPLPCHLGHPVQWKGCGAYFCQQYRPVGDPRGRCTAAMKECCDCGVMVCEVSLFSYIDLFR